MKVLQWPDLFTIQFFPLPSIPFSPLHFQDMRPPALHSQQLNTALRLAPLEQLVAITLFKIAQHE